MAGGFTKLYVAIWGDEDFRALTPPAQHLYLVLMSSPTRSNAGVADWRPNRIAKLAKGWTSGLVVKAAEELREARFILTDEETEEVLVRSFIRHDETLRQPNLSVSMRRAYDKIASPELREAVRTEVIRLASENPALKGLGAVRDLLPNPSGKGSENPSPNPSGNPSPNPSGKGSGKGSENPSGNPSPTTNNYNNNQQPSGERTSPEEKHSPSIVDASTDEPPAAPAETATKGKPRLPSGLRSAFEEFWAAYPRRTARAEAERKFAIAARNTEPALIVAAAKRYAAAVTNSEPRFIAHPSTWLHQGRWDDEPVAQAVGATRRKPWEDENGRQVGPIPWWAEQ